MLGAVGLSSLVGYLDMNAKSLIMLIALMSIPFTPVFGESEMVLHSSGAQCNAINWSIINKEKSYLLGQNLSEELFVSNKFNVGFLAQVMPTSGYPIKFLRDNTVDTTKNFKPTRWELVGRKLILKTDDNEHPLYSFSYSETCMTLVHEYSFHGSPQVVEIALVKTAP